MAEIEAELILAEKSRAGGFEGRARVCARRAAGIAIREYLLAHQISASSSNFYNLIQEFRNIPNLPIDLIRVVDHLTMKVNEDFNLPGEIDLITEVRWLVERLSSS
jgi:hypothetical protein